MYHHGEWSPFSVCVVGWLVLAVLDLFKILIQQITERWRVKRAILCFVGGNQSTITRNAHTVLRPCSFVNSWSCSAALHTQYLQTQTHTHSHFQQPNKYKQIWIHTYKCRNVNHILTNALNHTNNIQMHMCTHCSSSPTIFSIDPIW